MSKIKLKTYGNSSKKQYTLQDLYNSHMTDCKARELSRFTLIDYESNYHVLLRYLEPNVLLQDIDNELINELTIAMKQEGIKASTINNRLRYLKTFFNYAYENNMMDKLRIKMIKCKQEVKQPLSDEQVKKLLRKPKEDFIEYRGWVICNLILSTGIRSRNVIELKVGDIDFNTNTMLLRDTKSRKEQKIYLTASIKNILKEWIDRVGLTSDMALIPNQYGKPMSRYTFRSAFESYVKHRGVQTSPHILRHTFTKNLVRANVNPFIIKELLGHHDINITQRYVKVYGEDIEKANIDVLANYNKIQIK